MKRLPSPRLWAFLLATTALPAFGCFSLPPDNPPEQQAGELRRLPCDADEFYKFDLADQCGAANPTGVCTEIPKICTFQYDPVCGCDDNTYSSTCDANSHGVSVAAKGECKRNEAACGGLAGLSCAEGEFCNYDLTAQCGAADQTGTCTKIPRVCTREYVPVCGCNGKTYPTACVANAKGVSVASEGECPPASATCGGIAGRPCEKGAFCNYEPAAGGQGCGTIADASGVCQETPRICVQQYAPVCGCDGNTYGNACVAHAKGMSVASEGACAPKGELRSQ